MEPRRITGASERAERRLGETSAAPEGAPAQRGSKAQGQGDMSVGGVLFLDDSLDRYEAFVRRAPSGAEVVHARDAAEAIRYLENSDFDQVFLDHDLCEEEVGPGQFGNASTGMDVVDHICNMRRPPPSVVVHSMNMPAGEEMCRRLASLRAVTVQRIPFTELLRRIGSR